MKKVVYTLLLFTVLSFGILFIPTLAQADVIYVPEVIPGTSTENNILLIGVGILVGIIVLVSLLVINNIRKKKSGNHR